MLVVGGPSHVRTELLNLISWDWDLATPYPDANQVSSARTLFYKDSFYIFGSMVGGSFSEKIVRFDLKTWSVVGKVKSKRSNYSVLLLEDLVYVVGGSENSPSEECKLGGIVTCNQVENIGVKNLKNPTLFGFKQKGCEITASYKDKPENNERPKVTDSRTAK